MASTVTTSFAKGQLVQVTSAAAKPFAGQVCTVQYVEYVLEGTSTERLLVHLESPDNGNVFKLRSEFLQVLDAQCLPQQLAAVDGRMVHTATEDSVSNKSICNQDDEVSVMEFDDSD